MEVWFFAGECLFLGLCDECGLFPGFEAADIVMAAAAVFCSGRLFLIYRFLYFAAWCQVRRLRDPPFGRYYGHGGAF